MNSQATQTIKAETRELATKIARRVGRKNGLIPAILYSKGGSTQISVPAQSLPKEHTRANVVNLELSGSVKKVLMREVQVNPLNDEPLHFDFQEVSENDLVRVTVPLTFSGFTKEQEKEGTFAVLLRYLEVKTKVSSLPSFFNVDISHLKGGESVRLFDLTLPKDVHVCTGKGKNVALASIVRA